MMTAFLSTVDEQSDIAEVKPVIHGDVIFVIQNDDDDGDDDDMSFYSCNARIFAQCSPVMNKLMIKALRKSSSNDTHHDRCPQPIEIPLKFVTNRAFLFIRDVCYGSDTAQLTDEDVIDVLFASIKYQMKSLVKQCTMHLLDINNLTAFWSIYRAFASKPCTLFDTFFVNILLCKSSFVAQHLQQHIINDERFILHSSLFQIRGVCQYMLHQQLLAHPLCYALLVRWCQHQFRHKLEPLLRIQQQMAEREIDNDSIFTADQSSIPSLNDTIVIHHQREQEQDSLSLSTPSRSIHASTHYIVDDEHMITRWQDLFEDFLPLLDFVQMDAGYLLTQVRGDQVMSQQRLLAILVQKYETANADDGSHGTVDTSRLTNANQAAFSTDDLVRSPEQLAALTIGSKLDVRDQFGRYSKAEVSEMDQNAPAKIIKIHFIGLSKMWDKWMDIERNRSFLAPFGFISEREIQKTQLCDLRVGGKVIIKLPAFHKHHQLGWLNAEVIAMDKGQLNVQYKVSAVCADDTRSSEAHMHEFWVHADNESECR